MKIKKRLKDKAGMLVLTAVLVVAALIASVVSGRSKQRRMRFQQKLQLILTIVAIKKPRQQMQIRTAVRMLRYRIAIKALTKAVIKQIKRKLSMPRQMPQAKFMMCLWRLC